MSEERFLIILGPDPSRIDMLLDHPGLAAPLDLGPPVIILSMKPAEPFIRNLDIKIERENNRRDWEQRERKRRRK